MDEDTTGRKLSLDFKIETLTWEEQISVLRIMFPFVGTKAALQEKHFAKGYACSCRIYAIENQRDWSFMKQYLEQASEEYLKSYEEVGTPEAIANLLWTLCVGYAFSVGGEKEGEEREEYIRSCYETAMLLLGILRESKEYRALAEYYLALQYFIGMVGNGVGVDFNKSVGVELMRSLVILGNPYAVNFVEECESIGGLVRVAENGRRWSYVCEGKNCCNSPCREGGKKQGVCGGNRRVCEARKGSRKWGEDSDEKKEVLDNVLH